MLNLDYVSGPLLGKLIATSHQGGSHLMHLVQTEHNRLRLITRSQPPVGRAEEDSNSEFTNLPSCPTVTVVPGVDAGDFPDLESALKLESVACSALTSGAVGEVADPAARQSASASHTLDTLARMSVSTACADSSPSKVTS